MAIHSSVHSICLAIRYKYRSLIISWSFYFQNTKNFTFVDSQIASDESKDHKHELTSVSNHVRTLGFRLAQFLRRAGTLFGLKRPLELFKHIDTCLEHVLYSFLSLLKLCDDFNTPKHMFFT